MRRWRPSGATRAWRRGATRPWPGFVLVAVTAAAVLLAGCGIPTETTARSIPQGQVPPQVLSRQPPATTTTTSPDYSTNITLYFTVTFFQYVAPVTVQAKKPTLTTVLQVLLAGPSQVLTSKGYKTAFRTGVKLIHAQESNGVATVDFNATFGQLSGTFQVLAVAQVVFTVTANLSNVKAVKFQIDSRTTPVPTPASGLTPTPVGPSDYASLLRPQTRTTTSTTGPGGTTTTTGPGGTTATTTPPATTATTTPPATAAATTTTTHPATTTTTRPPSG